MELKSSRHGAVTVLEPAGQLDRETVRELQQCLAELVEEGERQIVIDLGKAEGVDGSGLRALLAASKKLEAMAGGLCLCSLGPPVRRALQLAGLAGVFVIRPDRAEAVQELAGDATVARISNLAAQLLATAEERDSPKEPERAES